MISNFNLDSPISDERKIVLETKMGGRWLTVEQLSTKIPYFKHAKKEIELINYLHFTPATFNRGYRSRNNYLGKQEWILIDCDDPNEHLEVQKILEEHNLTFHKVPSKSCTDDVNYKWHFFVKTKPLASTPQFVAAQINHFYDALGLKAYADTKAIDASRYFAPCGAAEVALSPEWKKRIKWCNDNSFYHKGKKWIPAEVKTLTPIHMSNTGSPAYIDIDAEDAPEDLTADGDYSMKFSKSKQSGGQYSFDKDAKTYRLDPKNKILTTDGWSTLGAIASKMKDGEMVSNMFGCPVNNPDHKKHGEDAFGYGYAERKGDSVFFSCGGNHCKKMSYYIYYKEVK